MMRASDTPASDSPQKQGDRRPAPVLARCNAESLGFGLRCTRWLGHAPTFHRNGRVQWPVREPLDTSTPSEE